MVSGGCLIFGGRSCTTSATLGDCFIDPMSGLVGELYNLTLRNNIGIHGDCFARNRDTHHTIYTVESALTIV